MLRQGGHIFRATKRYQWPNEGAAVIVSVVHVGRGTKIAPVFLNRQQLPRVSAYLVAGDFDDAPNSLTANEGKAYIGSCLLGMGFTFDDAASAKGEAESIDEMKRLIAKDTRNSGRIKPYIGGEAVIIHRLMRTIDMLLILRIFP